MRVWHLSAAPEPTGVDGLATYVWNLAAAQAERGHDVTLFVRTPATASASEEAHERAITLVEDEPSRGGFRNRAVTARLKVDRPDLVHLHDSWQRSHPSTAWALRRRGVPYLYYAHGALDPAVLRRRAWLRSLYTRLIEGPLIRRANGIVAVHEPELAQFIDVVGRRRLPPACLAHPLVELETIASTPRVAVDGRDHPVAVFLGRWDPYQKGLDRLSELACALPEVDFHLHGRPDSRFHEGLDDLMSSAPENLRFLDPVVGREKAEVLARAAVYVQMSRYEGFSLSVIEAMAARTPIAISEDMSLARTIEPYELGTVLASDTATAALQLRELLADPTRRAFCTQRAFEYVMAECSKTAIVDRLEAFAASIVREATDRTPPRITGQRHRRR